MPKKHVASHHAPAHRVKRHVPPKKNVTLPVTIELDKQSFEGAADTALAVCSGVYSQRGNEYADTWSLDHQCTTFLDATLRALGISDDLSREAKRLLLAASLIDVKDSRMLGGWKLDTVIDGIAYRAAYAEWRAEYEKKVRSG